MCAKYWGICKTDEKAKGHYDQHFGSMPKCKDTQQKSFAIGVYIIGRVYIIGGGGVFGE